MIPSVQMTVCVMKTTVSAHAYVTIHVLHELNAMLLLIKLYVYVPLVLMVTLSSNVKSLVVLQIMTAHLTGCALMVVALTSVFMTTNVPLKRSAAV